MITRETANAKINLALHVVGKREDNYHLLDTLVTFCDICDVLQVENAKRMRLKISGPFGDDVPQTADNIVLEAVDLVYQAIQAAGFHADPVSIRLEKNLPVASGIGGGSADAAAIIRALLQHWQFDARFIPIGDICRKLGADVPMCFANAPLRATGIGESVQPLDMPRLFMVLANPGIQVSTPDVFAALDQTNNPGIGNFTALPEIKGFTDQLIALENHLQPVTASANPLITEAIQELDALPGTLLSRMSGSGATCFALYTTMNEATTAARMLKRKQRKWWVAPTSTLTSISPSLDPEQSTAA